MLSPSSASNQTVPTLSEASSPRSQSPMAAPPSSLDFLAALALQENQSFQEKQGQNQPQQQPRPSPKSRDYFSVVLDGPAPSCSSDSSSPNPCSPCPSFSPSMPEPSPQQTLPPPLALLSLSQNQSIPLGYYPYFSHQPFHFLPPLTNSTTDQPQFQIRMAQSTSSPKHQTVPQVLPQKKIQKAKKVEEADLFSHKPHKRAYKKAPVASDGKCCSSCNTSVTPEWRSGPQGPKTLCNACGLQYAKNMKAARTVQ